MTLHNYRCICGCGSSLIDYHEPSDNNLSWLKVVCNPEAESTQDNTMQWAVPRSPDPQMLDHSNNSVTSSRHSVLNISRDIMQCIMGENRGTFYMILVAMATYEACNHPWIQYTTFQMSKKERPHSQKPSWGRPRDKKGWTQRVGLANVSPKGLYHGIRGWFKLDSGS